MHSSKGTLQHAPNVLTDLWRMGGLLQKTLHSVGIEVGTKPRPPSNAAAASLVLTLTGTNVALYSTMHGRAQTLSTETTIGTCNERHPILPRFHVSHNIATSCLQKQERTSFSLSLFDCSKNERKKMDRRARFFVGHRRKKPSKAQGPLFVVFNCSVLVITP